ncbi:hypothetical protein BC829DRAFT_445946 [Chytridium lagenaria]|nr:hypothetical protein BC829DRAFT_445946 [Chytridium lagenaria]
MSAYPTAPSTPSKLEQGGQHPTVDIHNTTNTMPQGGALGSNGDKPNLPQMNVNTGSFFRQIKAREALVNMVLRILQAVFALIALISLAATDFKFFTYSYGSVNGFLYFIAVVTIIVSLVLLILPRFYTLPSTPTSSSSATISSSPGSGSAQPPLSAPSPPGSCSFCKGRKPVSDQTEAAYRDGNIQQPPANAPMQGVQYGVNNNAGMVAPERHQSHAGAMDQSYPPATAPGAIPAEQPITASTLTASANTETTTTTTTTTTATATATP